MSLTPAGSRPDLLGYLPVLWTNRHLRTLSVEIREDNSLAVLEEPVGLSEEHDCRRIVSSPPHCVGYPTSVRLYNRHQEVVRVRFCRCSFQWRKTIRLGRVREALALEVAASRRISSADTTGLLCRNAK